jgi:Flp pilus assembly protein TadG
LRYQLCGKQQHLHCFSLKIELHMNGLAMRKTLNAIATKARAFVRSKRGNVAMMFAIAMVPMTLAAGAGLDFARAMLVRQQMTGALDAAALAVGSTTGLDQTAAQALAQKYFDANYTVDKTAFGTPTVTIPTSGYNDLTGSFCTKRFDRN